MKLTRAFFADYSIINSRIALVVSFFICGLQPNTCLAMGPNDACFKNQAPIDRLCNIGSMNVPMNPSPSFRTNCGASVIVQSKARIASFKQVEEAPVTKRPCGSAPVTNCKGNTYYVRHGQNQSPHFSATTCPKAPIIRSYPSTQSRATCK
jgi:hypothetical protein